VAVLGEMLHLN